MWVETVENPCGNGYSALGDMSEPDFLICLVCETPTYDFEWEDGRVKEGLCSTCGNDERSEFLTPEEFEQEE